MDDRWNELDALLDAALDLSGPEREAFLRDRCPDPADRERLARLIAAAEDDTFSAGGALEGRLGNEFADFLDEDALLDTIAGYRLLRPIGSGGMGHVWEAEQLEPVRRRVAVKIIRPELGTSRVVARFESERQTLALMNHPGIAQMFDAGVTDSGRSFFAMEYVDGQPLQAFCDEAKLSVRERLRLFLEVCDAVQHAHQRGVIHRDLKPSNVMVTRIDGRPSPKVIDFGIARLAEVSPGTLLTEAGTIIGTPEYMSPEQAGSNPAGVDTRTDVYSLGVLLYELLTGSLPFERKDASPADLAEMFREVREVEPPPPSRRITSLGERAWTVAAARDTDAWGLRRALRRDLDWITTRALEKDPERRYASVGELAADLSRHLNDEPVLAGPPGAVYRLRKFVRRNSGLLVALAAILVALIAGLVGTMVGLVRARDEAERARTQAAIAHAVNEFLNEDLLAAVAPSIQGRDVTMREVLDVAAERLEGRFAGQPEVEATVRHTIGDTYIRLGRLDDASPHLERAVALRTQALGADDPSTLTTIHALGELRFYQGRVEEAGDLIRRCFEGRERALGPNDPATLTALSDLGAVAQDQGMLDEAERHYRDAYERAIVELDEDDPTVLSMLHNLGALLRDRGQLDEAEAFLRRALDGSRRGLGAEHPETLSTLSLLGSVLREKGQLEAAEPIYVEAYDIRRRILGNEHPSTLISANNLGILQSDLGQFEAAEALQRETLEIQRRVLGDDHDATILSLGNLGSTLTRMGRAEDARSLLAEAVERCERTLGSDHSLCSASLRKQGECFTALGLYEEAQRVLQDAYVAQVGALGDTHPSAQQTAAKLVELYELWGRDADAATWRARAASSSNP